MRVIQADFRTRGITAGPGIRNGIPVSPDYGISDNPEAEIVIVPARRKETFRQARRTLYPDGWLSRNVPSGIIIALVCVRQAVPKGTVFRIAAIWR